MNSVLPRMDGMTAEFYGWLGKGQLRLQRCGDCHTFRHVPRVLCPMCASARWAWEASSGRGRVVSWTTTVRPVHPAFTDTPFTVAMVEMDEGPRVLAQLDEVEPDAVRMGLPVRATFHPATDDIALVHFEPEEPAGV